MPGVRVWLAGENHPLIHVEVVVLNVWYLFGLQRIREHLVEQGRLARQSYHLRGVIGRVEFDHPFGRSNAVRQRVVGRKAKLHVLVPMAVLPTYYIAGWRIFNCFEYFILFYF